MADILDTLAQLAHFVFVSLISFHCIVSNTLYSNTMSLDVDTQLSTRPSRQVCGRHNVEAEVTDFESGKRGVLILAYVDDARQHRQEGAVVGLIEPSARQNANRKSARIE